MLFNSYGFIFVFLPIVLGVFACLQKYGTMRMMTGWLVLASLFFYGWWNPVYLLLIGLSIGANFTIGCRLSNIPSKTALTMGIAFNLLLIGWFKYAMFFGDIFDYSIGTIILPLAISFFTFQQIAYLVDAYKGKTQEYDFLNYCLFVTFFPQLIAGPIVHHKDMMPQFANKKILGISTQNIAIGLTFFFIGLFKKVVIADEMATYATPIFDTADNGDIVTFAESWVAALAYTFQLYFDFSGYSDMAMGLARLFGIQLPLNFFSPYKATNIIDFWRRWHITLSQFLRDYLYIPLGGNRHGNARRYTNIIITMLLGGLWHGAGWNFILWGGLHGLYLTINHMWRYVCNCLNLRIIPAFIGLIFGWMITFLSIVMGWVFFRAQTLDGAFSMLKSMIGLNGIALPRHSLEKLTPMIDAIHALGFETQIIGVFPILGQSVSSVCAPLMFVFILTLVAPNTMQFMRRVLRNPASIDFAPLNTRKTFPLLDKIMPVWKANWFYAIIMAGITTLSILSLTRISEFLYFQF